MKRSFANFVRKLDRIGLRDPIEKRALARHISLRDLYDGPRTLSISAARRDVYTWLRSTHGKGINEIARLFDRAPNGVMKMTRGNDHMRKTRGKAKTL